MKKQVLCIHSRYIQTSLDIFELYTIAQCKMKSATTPHFSRRRSITMKRCIGFFVICLTILVSISCRQKESAAEKANKQFQTFWVVNYLDSKFNAKLIISKQENEQYYIKYSLDNNIIEFEANQCTKEEIPVNDAKHWVEKITFKKNNDYLVLTIEGGQDMKPIVTQAKGQFGSTKFNINKTAAYEQYLKNHYVKTTNIKYENIPCSSASNNLEGNNTLFTIDFYGENENIKEEFLEFWQRFQNSLVNYDTENIIRLSKFPFETNGPLDHFPVVEYDRDDEFLIVLDEFFNQEFGHFLNVPGFEKKFMRYIENDKLILSNDYAKIQNMCFKKHNNQWKFCNVFFEEELYEQMPKVLETYKSAVVKFSGVSFMPELSIISFTDEKGEKIEFFLQDTPVDINNNEFFESIVSEEATFPEFKPKASALNIKYKIYYDSYERRIPLANGEIDEFLRLKKYLKLK